MFSRKCLLFINVNIFFSTIPGVGLANICVEQLIYSWADVCFVASVSYLNLAISSSLLLKFSRKLDFGSPWEMI